MDGCVCHLSPPAATGTAWTGDFWSKSVSLKWKNKQALFFQDFNDFVVLIFSSSFGRGGSVAAVAFGDR